MSGYGSEVYGEDSYDEATQNHLPDHWISRVQNMMEFPQNHQTLRFFEAWQQAEGGSAEWNPLNTTIDVGGTVEWTAGDYNTSHVKNYKYSFVGIIAIVMTLQQRNADGSLVYGTLVNNLKNPNLTAEQIVNNSTASLKLWGTNPTTMLEVLKGIV